jgi:hypothetical protein
VGLNCRKTILFNQLTFYSLKTVIAMKKAEAQKLLADNGIEFDVRATGDNLLAIAKEKGLIGSFDVEQAFGWKLMKSSNDNGFARPQVDTPSPIKFSRATAKTGANAGRSMTIMELDGQRFIMWTDFLQGRLEAEQKRLREEGRGIQVYQVVGEGDAAEFKVNPSLLYTCDVNTGLAIA